MPTPMAQLAPHRSPGGAPLEHALARLVATQEKLALILERMKEPTVLMEGSIRSRLMEALSLTTDDYRAYAIPLLATLSSTQQTGSDTFKAPSTHHFLITGVRGFIAGLAQTTDPLSIPGVGNPFSRDRLAIKGQNTLVKLFNQDDNFNLIDHATLPLAAIMAVEGGQPMDFTDAPHKLPAGQTMEADFSLADATASIIGGNYSAGVLLSGYLVRKREG